MAVSALPCPPDALVHSTLDKITGSANLTPWISFALLLLSLTASCLIPLPALSRRLRAPLPFSP